MKRELSPAQLRAIFSKKIGMQWTPKVPFEEETIKMLRNDSGNYELFDKDGRELYVGSTHKIKHRVESYSELDSAKVHPTKVELRPKIDAFRVRYVPLSEARIHERNIKDRLELPFNMDNPIHEEIKKERKE